MYLEVLLLGICVTCSIFFSGAETGFLTWNVLKVKHRALAGDIVARWGLFLVGKRDQLISAILIGNNCANIGSSLVFVALVDKLLPQLPAVFSRIPSPESWILTPFLLLLGEMLPKSLFRIYPFRLTMRVVPFMMIFYVVTFPLTWLFSLLTGFRKKNISHKNSSYAARVREEIVLIASEGSKTGSLFRSADQFIETVMLLDDKKAGDIIGQTMVRGVTCGEATTVGEAKKSISTATTVVLVAGKDGVISGYVTLIDIAAAQNSAVVGTLKKKIRKVNKRQSVLTVFRSVNAREDALIEIVDDDGLSIGITDTVGLLTAAFDNFQHPVRK